MSRASSIDIRDKNNVCGYQLSYRSHIEMKYLIGEQTFFRFNNQVFTQKSDRIFQSCFGVHKSVKILAFYVTKIMSSIDVNNAENFIYDQAAQLKLHKKYLKYINPEKFEEKMKIVREKDIARNKHSKRKLEQRELDRKRSKSESRIAARKDFEKIRNATPSKKAVKNAFDKKRNATSSRKAAKREAENKRNTKPSRIQSKNAFDEKQNATSSRKAAKKKGETKRNATPSRIQAKVLLKR